MHPDQVVKRNGMLGCFLGAQPGRHEQRKHTAVRDPPKISSAIHAVFLHTFESSDQRGTAFSYTNSPPTKVSSTTTSFNSSAGTVSTSLSTTMKSANFPASSEPFCLSSNPSYAPFRVYSRSASRTPMRSSGANTLPDWASRRVTAAQMPHHGLIGVTSTSEPAASTTPFSRHDFAGSA